MCQFKIVLDTCSYAALCFCVALETISSIPLQLEEDDIEDFCSLAQYYMSRTPQSFRKVGTSSAQLTFDAHIHIPHRLIFKKCRSSI